MITFLVYFIRSKIKEIKNKKAELDEHFIVHHENNLKVEKDTIKKVKHGFAIQEKTS